MDYRLKVNEKGKADMDAEKSSGKLSFLKNRNK